LNGANGGPCPTLEGIASSAIPERITTENTEDTKRGDRTKRSKRGTSYFDIADRKHFANRFQSRLHPFVSFVSSVVENTQGTNA
jgi:hypothetical protein